MDWRRVEWSGLESSAVEWSGVKWSEVESSGVAWSRVELSGVRWIGVEFSGVPSAVWSGVQGPQTQAVATLTDQLLHAMRLLM